MTFGDWVREGRLKGSWTQADLARLVSANAQTVSRWERNEFRPDLEMFRKLCALFKCPADEPLRLLDEVPAPVDKGAA
jgi:transcriptional regulator with XRE-family HTH domain